MNPLQGHFVYPIIPLSDEETLFPCSNHMTAHEIIEERGGSEQFVLEVRQRALQFCIEKFGEESPHTAAGLNTVGVSLRDMNKNEEALAYQQKALEIRKKTLGEEHTFTVASYKELSITLGNLGRHEEARVYQQKALEIETKTLDKNSFSFRSKL